MNALAFAILFVLCTVATASMEFRIDVKLLDPFHIEFNFAVSNTFEPVTLKAHVSTNAMELIVFQVYDYKIRKTFRNVMPLSLTDNCIISAELEYIESMDFDPRSLGNGYNRENDIKRVKFDYAVSAKPDDQIYIELFNRPGEGDSVNAAPTKKPSFLRPAFGNEDGGGDIDLPTDAKPTVNYSNTIDEIFGNVDKDKENPIEDSNDAITPADAGEYVGEDPDDPDEECDEQESMQSSVYQRKLLETAFAHGRFGRRLLLTGDIPPLLRNPVETIREIIVNTLELPELRWHILQAKFLEQSILFEMAAPKDAIEVLTNASLYLKKMNIASTERDFFDVGVIGSRLSDVSMGR